MNELDTVALLQDLPEHSLKRGQVGAIVAILDTALGVYEVEFVGNDGRTYAMLTLTQDQLMLLHYEPTT